MTWSTPSFFSCRGSSVLTFSSWRTSHSVGVIQNTASKCSQFLSSSLSKTNWSFFIQRNCFPPRRVASSTKCCWLTLLHLRQVFWFYHQASWRTTLCLSCDDVRYNVTPSGRECWVRVLRGICFLFFFILHVWTLNYHILLLLYFLTILCPLWLPCRTAFQQFYKEHIGYSCPTEDIFIE